MPTDPSYLYRWRKLTALQRAEVMQDRITQCRPRHSIPHVTSDITTYYMFTAACFEHKPVIGQSPNRILQFEDDLVSSLNDHCREVFAWSVLPNHYHVLVDTLNVKSLLRALGQLHGRNSYFWNRDENRRGRQVWCNVSETAIKSEGHFYASLNYVLHNAVHHGYVDKWLDWPYCNADEYLERCGRNEAAKIWNSYPLYEFG